MTIRLALVAALSALLTIPLMAQLKRQEIDGIRNYSRVDANVGFGGQVDFTRGAARSRGGKPIIALGSTALRAGRASRAGRPGTTRCPMTFRHREGIL